jgi:hypothetical protein
MGTIRRRVQCRAASRQIMYGGVMLMSLGVDSVQQQTCQADELASYVVKNPKCLICGW